MDAPYLVTENNGHMYPTKSYDNEHHRTYLAKRHARVLNDVAMESGLSGSFSWCAFDYNTHKDFGSGDRICYHGVMDMFRNPKMAAYVYKAEGCSDTVLQVSSNFDIGETPGGGLEEAYIFSNADKVRMYINDVLIKEYTRDDSPYTALKHGPMYINDYIGNQLIDNEGFSHKKSELLKTVLHDIALHMNHLSLKDYVSGGRLLLFHHLSWDEGNDYYAKYLGGWGQTNRYYRFEAIKNGEVVKTLVKGPAKDIHIKLKSSHDVLREDKSYEVALIHVLAVDGNGNTLPFYNDAVNVEVTGPIELIGPKTLSLNGGGSGIFVKTTGEAGEGKVVVTDVNNNKYEKIIKIEVQTIE